MAYIGKSIESGTFSVLDTSGNTYNGSNVTFSLGTQVGSVAQLLVSHDGVLQKPGTDYTLATGGTQITFTTAPASGASIFIVEISGAVGGTITPSDTSVTADKLNTALLTGQTDIGANIADADLFLVDDGAGGTLRKTAASRLKTYAGFSVSSITGATELAAQPAATDEIVLSDAGTLKRLDIKHIQNTPAVMTQKGSNQTVATGTATLITFDVEDLDTDGTFASNRFTPAVAGYYFCFGLLAFDELSDGKGAYSILYKNGSHYLSSANQVGANTSLCVTEVSATIYLDGDDYVELYGQHNHGSDRTAIGNSSTECFFGAFRIAGA